MGYLNEDGLATLVGKVKGQVVQLTSAEYRNLPSSKNSDNKTYFVTDEDYAYAIDDEPTLNSDNLVKSGGVYTYTSKIGSGTLTTTAQTIIPAINELDAAIDTIKNGLTYSVASINTTYAIGAAHKWGRVVFASIYNGEGGNISANTVLATLPVGFRPLANAEFINTYTKTRMRINENGELVAVEAISSSYVRGSVVYLTA